MGTLGWCFVGIQSVSTHISSDFDIPSMAEFSYDPRLRVGFRRRVATYLPGTDLGECEDDGQGA